MKKVLITGTSAGIGKVVFEYLSSCGYEVFGCGRRKVDLPNYLQIDLEAENSAEILYQKAFEYLGGVDIVINNAGKYIYSKIEDMKNDDITSTIKLNFEIPYKLISKAIPYMKQNKFGRIINIGSISGVVGEGYATLYSATKSSFLGLTKALALEVAEFGITVNTINPGWVEGELADNNSQNEISREDNLQVIPQKRYIEPIEIAKLCEYLITDGAKGMTGQGISLCAGLSVG